MAALTSVSSFSSKTVPVRVASPFGQSLEIGHAREFCVIAGPCSVENHDQFLKTARAVKSAGASLLRGGLYKLRSNPNSFQGLGSEGFGFAREVCQHVKMPFVSEIIDPRHVEIMHDHVEVFQVGTRNMYNYALLKELGKTRKPVLLKRAFSATVEEWLLAAEYIVAGGNEQVILCERGVRGFDKITRNILDLGAVAWIKQNSKFPVIVDPSHAVGRSDLVAPLALAAAVAGADALLVEVHSDPQLALSDADQALSLEQFSVMMKDLGRVLNALGRKLVSQNERSSECSHLDAQRPG